VSGTVRIRGIAAGGDGVGTLPDGRTVFVPRTAAGDLVELAGLRPARRFARARVGRLLESAPERVAPRCEHYVADECGGCQLQHLSSGAQRAARRQVVGDALRRIGHLDAENPPLEPSPTEWEYRTKVTLSSRGGRIGYHRLGHPGQVFELERCPIARPELNRLWSALRGYRGLLPTNLDQIVLRVDRAGACHVIARGRSERAWTRGKELGRALSGDGTPAVLWWQPPGGAARTISGSREAYPVMVFEQVHPAMGDRIRDYAVRELGALDGRHVWDLYAGIGETSRTIAAQGATVESVERDGRAVRLAEAQGPAKGVTRIAGRVEDVIGRLRKPNAIIANPPRSGLGAEVTSRLPDLPASRLVYLSCDPATLARDLARLDPGYRIRTCRAFDLFPQTAHVETVVGLERR